MPSADIRNLKQCLEAIEVRLASLKSETAKLEEQAKNFKGVIQFFEEGGMESQSLANRNATIPILEEAMEDILRQHGNVLHYATVHKKLLERGVHVKGENPARNTGSHLSLDKQRFASWGAGQWGLAEWKDDPNFRPVFDRSYQEAQSGPAPKPTPCGPAPKPTPFQTSNSDTENDDTERDASHANGESINVNHLPVGHGYPIGVAVGLAALPTRN